MVRVLLQGVVAAFLTILLAGSVIGADTDPGACDLQRLAFMPKAEDIERIEALLGQGANVNGKCRGSTLLLKACQLVPGGNENKIRLVQLLLERGADPNLPDNLGNTPLINLLKPAPHSGGDIVAVAKLLLAAGADVNTRDKQGNSALVLGLKHANREVSQIFKTHSEKGSQASAPGGTPAGESPK